MAFDTKIFKQNFLPQISLDSGLTKNYSETEILNMKLSILERILEAIRFEERIDDSVVSMSKFYSLDSSISESGFHFKQGTSKSKVSPLTPEKLMVPLLINLLADRQAKSVLLQIHGFVTRIRGKLHPIDFEKTATNAVRIFTNTRFAALKLRDLGLLRRSKLYKRWELTFFGIILAGYLFQNDFHIPEGDYKDFIGKDKDYVPNFLHNKLKQLQDETKISSVMNFLMEDGNDLASMEELNKQLAKEMKLFNATSSIQGLSEQRKKEQLIRLIKKLDGIPDLSKFISKIKINLDLEKTLVKAYWASDMASSNSATKNKEK